MVPLPAPAPGCIKGLALPGASGKSPPMLSQVKPDARIASVSPLALALAVLLPSTGLARGGSRQPDSLTTHEQMPGQVGMASWHAPGRSSSESRTASGRRWVGQDLVAAHRSLPFGSRVRVVNLRNGRNVVVQITDRGPYARGRIIDLSRSAAVALDLIDVGCGRVRLEKP